ncbi:MAG: class I SAM-dependent methyltransferase [Cyclobacteriaceae bacterium]|nr:class I SAM-dependent methyltransferase [Cyclobacteriaceae bacterium]
MDINGTLEFFERRYLISLRKHIKIEDSLLADCACGFGWFAFAYIMSGGKRAIAIDVDSERLEAARCIGALIGVNDKIEYRLSALDQIELAEDEVDVFVCIETLEHVGKERIGKSLSKIVSSTSNLLLITTPNKWFPIIAHDTRIPFLHWLAPRYRRTVARIFRRGHLDEGNEFLSPLDFRIIKKKFRPISRCLTFDSVLEYIEQYPIYLPYGPDEKRRHLIRPNPLKRMYLTITSMILGRNSYWIMPSMARIFIRK